jgi:hypothetical protein
VHVLRVFSYDVITASTPVMKGSFSLPFNGKQWDTFVAPYGIAPKPKNGYFLSESYLSRIVVTALRVLVYWFFV